MEWSISGYCRTQDQARIVFTELEDGQWDWGCDFPNCAFAAQCTVGQQLEVIRKEQKA